MCNLFGWLCYHAWADRGWGRTAWHHWCRPSIGSRWRVRAWKPGAGGCSLSLPTHWGSERTAGSGTPRERFEWIKWCSLTHTHAEHMISTHFVFSGVEDSRRKAYQAGPGSYCPENLCGSTCCFCSWWVGACGQPDSLRVGLWWREGLFQHGRKEHRSPLSDERTAPDSPSGAYQHNKNYVEHLRPQQENHLLHRELDWTPE